MKNFLKISILALTMFVLPFLSKAQMWNSTTGAKVAFAYPVGAYGINNYVAFPSTQDTTLKSADTITPYLWASTEAVNIDTMKLHKNILKLVPPVAAVNGDSVNLMGYTLYLSAHTFDSVRPLYIYQNGVITDTVSVYKKNVRSGFIYKLTSGIFERLF